MTDELVNKEDVLKAYKVLRNVVRQTPLQHDAYLSQKYHANIFLKREDLQIVRSFKLRGAYYAISQLSEAETENGVICASAGNHAQGVAYTCNHLGIKATIFMPSTTPSQKIDQVRYFGKDYVEIKLIGDTFDESNKAAHSYAEEHKLTFIEPFNDRNVIAGQGSLAVEIHQDLVAEGETADMVFAAIGGGGLISGISSYMKEAMPETKIIGVESLGAPGMKASLDADKVTTLTDIDKFCDGTAVATVGDLTFRHCQKNVDDILVVPEGQVCGTIIDLYTKQAIVAEPSGALSVSALEQYKDEIRDKTVVCIVSGGNNDINRMAEIDERSLLYQGLKHYFIVNFPQRAGALKEFVNDILGSDDDITKFEYTKKVHRSVGPVLIGILLKNKDDIEGLLSRLEKFDPHYISVNENSKLYSFLI